MRHRFALTLGLLAATVLGWASWQVFALLRSEESPALAEIIVQVGLHSFFLFVLLRDVVAVPGHLFRAADTSLLGTVPLSSARLLAYRLVEAVLDSAESALPFGAPFLLAFALASPHPVSASVAAACSLLSLLILSVLIVAVVSILWPDAMGRSGHRRRALFRISTLVFLVGFLALLTRSGSEALGGANLAGIATALAALEAFFPSGWAGRWAASAAEGQFFVPGAIASFALATGGLALVVRGLVNRWDLSRRQAGEAGESGSRRGGSRRLRSPGPFGRWRAARLPALLWRRDAMLIAREPGMVLDLATMALLLGLLPILWRLQTADGDPTQWGFLLAAVVGAELAYEIASRSLPLERGATRWIRAAPVSRTSECLARPILGMLVGWSVAALVLAAGAALFGGSPGLGWTVALLLLLVPPAAVLGWAGSLVFGEAAWRHPRQMLRLPGRLMLIGVAVLAGATAAAVDSAGPVAGSTGRPLPVGAAALGCLLATTVVFTLSVRLRASLE